MQRFFQECLLPKLSIGGFSEVFFPPSQTARSSAGGQESKLPWSERLELQVGEPRSRSGFSRCTKGKGLGGGGF